MMRFRVLFEERIVQAAFYDKGTGKIYPSGPHHDLTAIGIPEDQWTDDFFDRLVSGFLTDRGRFLNREEAAAAVAMDPKMSLRSEQVRNLFTPRSGFTVQQYDPELRQ